MQQPEAAIANFPPSTLMLPVKAIVFSRFIWTKWGGGGTATGTATLMFAILVRVSTFTSQSWSSTAVEPAPGAFLGLVPFANNQLPG